jgi:alpha-beta hydrolase superfamily lysophospholipase
VIREVRMDAYWGLIQLADSASDQAPSLQVPSLLLYGGKDNSVPAAGISHLHDHLADRGEYRFYPQGPHLLLQGPQWQNVADHILDWVARTSP